MWKPEDCREKMALIGHGQQADGAELRGATGAASPKALSSSSSNNLKTFLSFSLSLTCLSASLPVFPKNTSIGGYVSL